MAISKDSLTVEVVLDSSGAVKGIKDLQGKFTEFDKVVSSASQSTNKANQANNQLASTFSGVASVLSKAALPMLAVSSAATAINQAFGFLSSTLGDFVNDYAEAEKAQVLLTRAIENSNGRIRNSADAWGTYLDQLQETKNVSGDFLRTLVTQGIQLGFSETQIKSLIDASIGLSKVTGEDVGSAFEKLINSTRGVSRGLAVLVPEVASLTEEQLKSGAAFEIVANKFSRVASGAGTYSEAVKAAKLASGELSEDIGKLIIESLNLTGTIESITGFINKLRSAIDNVSLDVLITKFIEVAKVLAVVVPIVSAITVSVAALEGAISLAIPAIVLVTAKIVLIGVAVTAAVAALELIIRNVRLFGEALMVLSRGGKGLDELKKKIDIGFSGEVIKQGINFVNGFTDATKKATSSLGELGKEGTRAKIANPADLEKAKGIVSDILSFTKQLATESENKNKGELGAIEVQLQKNLELIAKKREQLVAVGQLTEKNRELLVLAEKAAYKNAESAGYAQKEKEWKEQQKKAMDSLTSSSEKINSSYEAAKTANLGTFDAIQKSYDVELAKVQAVKDNLMFTGQLNAETMAGLEEQRNKLEEMKKLQESGAWMTGVSSAISAAGGGADALVGNIIDQVGAAFGPEGKMIAGALNLLRRGGEFIGQLFDSVIDIIVHLPENLVEGIKALLNGIVKLFDNPQTISSLIKNIISAVPQIIAAFIRALPQLAIALSRPSFWIEIAKAFVQAMIDSIPEMLTAYRDAFKDIGKEIVAAVKNAVEDLKEVFTKVFSAVGDFFKNLFKFDGGGTGAVEKFLGFDFPWIAFAEGGVVPGKAKVLGDSSKNDTVPALLSPGEAVIPRSMMADKGVRSFVDSLFSGKAIQSHFLGIPGTKSVPFGDKEVNAVGDGIKQAGDFLGDLFVPDWIKDLYNSIKKFVSDIDLKELVLHPIDTLEKAIKSYLSFLQEPFRKMMGFADGGMVPGYGFTDSVPSMLTPGEFVLNRNAVQSLGNGVLNQLNRGQIPGSQSSPIFNINLNIETTDAIDANFVRNTLLPTIKSELKASSLRGDFILSAKGVRS